MEKPLLTKLSETEVNEYLSLYNSTTKLESRTKEYAFVSRTKYAFVSRTKGMSYKPTSLGTPYQSDAVSIFVKNKDNTKMLLIKEFRYPINNYVISTPAGLIDKKESITDAAIRELYEEVGYQQEQIEVKSILQPSYSAIGLSDEQTASVFVTVDDTISPKQHLEGTEDIFYFWITPHDAEFFLENGYFNNELMRHLGYEDVTTKIGVTARTQFMLKQFADTLPSKSFREFIDSI